MKIMNEREREPETSDPLDFLQPIRTRTAFFGMGIKQGHGRDGAAAA